MTETSIDFSSFVINHNKMGTISFIVLYDCHYHDFIKHGNKST